jgi:hypothetical protein
MDFQRIAGDKSERLANGVRGVGDADVALIDGAGGVWVHEEGVEEGVRSVAAAGMLRLRLTSLWK